MRQRTFLSVNLNDTDSKIQNLPNLGKKICKNINPQMFNIQHEKKLITPNQGEWNHGESAQQRELFKLKPNMTCATCPTPDQWLNNPPSHYPASQ